MAGLARLARKMGRLAQLARKMDQLGKLAQLVVRTRSWTLAMLGRWPVALEQTRWTQTQETWASTKLVALGQTRSWTRSWTRSCRSLGSLGGRLAQMGWWME